MTSLTSPQELRSPLGSGMRISVQGSQEMLGKVRAHVSVIMTVNNFVSGPSEPATSRVCGRGFQFPESRHSRHQQAGQSV